MSKDKGHKNHKKPKADKTTGKKKAISAFKAEGRNGKGQQPTIDIFTPKPGDKTNGSPKKK